MQDLSLIHICGSDTEQNGNFKWVSGEAVTYSNWKNGEPNASEKGEGIKEKYVEIYSDSGEWNDNDETKEFGFILEISNDKDTVKTYQELGEMDDKIVSSEGYEYQERISDSHGNEYLQMCIRDSYNMTKDKKTHPDRMETKKYCKFCRTHTVHKETK